MTHTSVARDALDEPDPRYEVSTFSRDLQKWSSIKEHQTNYDIVGHAELR